MCLVYQEYIILPRLVLPEIAFESDPRIKGIVVVSDDDIAPVADIQRILIRTHSVLFGIFRYDFPRDHTLMRQYVVYCVIDSVKMSICIFACVRVAGKYLIDA